MALMQSLWKIALRRNNQLVHAAVGGTACSVAPTSSSGKPSSARGNHCDDRVHEFSVWMGGVKRKFPGDFDVCHCCIKETHRLTNEVYRLGSFSAIQTSNCIVFSSFSAIFPSFSKHPPAVDDALKQSNSKFWFVLGCPWYLVTGL